MDSQIRLCLDRVLQRGLKRLAPGLRPVMVVSHERSGTHFAMNTLAACFGYASRPWVDIDAGTFNINYFHAPQFGELVQTFADLRTASLGKSHHEFAFFADFIGQLQGLEFVYVHRRPADVMASFWRFMHGWPWVEGPRSSTLLHFAETQPMGGIMRYQYRQSASMLDRWYNHVGGWVEAAAQYENVHVLRYEDLEHDFEGTVVKLGQQLKAEPIRILQPDRDENVIGPGPLPFSGVEGPQDRQLVHQMALRRYPALMRRLGYLSDAEAQTG